MYDVIKEPLASARARREFAHWLMRRARLDPVPKCWGVEHSFMKDAREELRQARLWVIEAKRRKLAYELNQKLGWLKEAAE